MRACARTTPLSRRWSAHLVEVHEVSVRLRGSGRQADSCNSRVRVLTPRDQGANPVSLRRPIDRDGDRWASSRADGARCATWFGTRGRWVRFPDARPRPYPLYGAPDIVTGRHPRWPAARTRATRTMKPVAASAAPSRPRNFLRAPQGAVLGCQLESGRFDPDRPHVRTSARTQVPRGEALGSHPGPRGSTPLICSDASVVQ
jgi:hypothetical protein